VADLPRRLVQVAYLVTDVDEAAARWARTTGAGPFLVRRHMAVRASYRGRPAVYDHSAAFGQWGAVMLELVQLHEVSPPEMAESIHHARPGQLHHFACIVDDLETTSTQLQADGMPLVMELVSTSGMPVHFLDSRALDGALLELYPTNEYLEALYARVASLAVGWDGGDPVRAF
jgi:hypothetical protein